MRQQQVETWWLLRHQCLINGYRIVGQIYRAQNPSVEGPVFGPPEQGKGGVHLRETAAAVSEATMTVVGRAIAV